MEFPNSCAGKLPEIQLIHVCYQLKFDLTTDNFRITDLSCIKIKDLELAFRGDSKCRRRLESRGDCWMLVSEKSYIIKYNII